DPGPLVDLIEDPPSDVYRLKGAVTVDTGRGPRGFVVNIVGRQIHVVATPIGDGPAGLVAIGMHWDQPAIRARLEAALRPCSGRPAADDVRRLSRYRRLSTGRAARRPTAAARRGRLHSAARSGRSVRDRAVVGGRLPSRPWPSHGSLSNSTRDHAG